MSQAIQGWAEWRQWRPKGLDSGMDRGQAILLTGVPGSVLGLNSLEIGSSWTPHPEKGAIWNSCVWNRH